MMRNNESRVALVTGASSGIGRATALALKAAGYRVFGTSRKGIGQDLEGITILKCDVTDEGSVRDMVAETLKQGGGRIDLLVNNAGIGLYGGAEESSIAQAQALFDVNLFGTLRVTNAVLPTMRQQRRGRIVNVSSVLGFVPSPYNALYSSTKHAVEGYSESLDHELRSFGIRVVLVEPALTRTSFEENIIKPDRVLPIYDADRARINSLLPVMIKSGDAPEVVAATILMAATQVRPRLRYAAGKQARQVRFLRRYLPESMVDRAIRKFNQLSA